MKKKRFLGFVMAMTMILGSTMTSMAADPVISGDGDVKYVNTTVYEVDLPTTASLNNLIVDPQGLTGMTGTTATLEELDPYAGRIYCETKPVISNKGSVPTKVTVKLKVEGDATLKESEAEVTVSGNDAAGKTYIMMYAVPSSVDVKGDAANYVASTTGVLMSDQGDGAEVSFILPGADYVVKKDVSGNDISYSYVLKDENDLGHGTALSFEGVVNRYANWLDYAGASATKRISMAATFTFENDLATTDVADTTEGAPYGMMAKASGIVEVKSVAPAATKTNVVESDGTNDIVVYYTGTKPTSFTLTPVKTTGTKKTVLSQSTSDDTWTVDNEKVTLKKAWLAQLIAASSRGKGTYKLTINGQDTTITLK